LSIYFLTILATMSYNVPAVTDVFLRPMRKNAKHFYGRKKMWRNKTPQRRIAPTGVLWSLAAYRRRTVTVLLHDDFFTPTYNRLPPWTAEGDPINFYSYCLLYNVLFTLYFFAYCGVAA